MFSSENLAPLLTGDTAGGELGFASGTLESWDDVTGANTVTMGGAQLVNVPLLNTSDVVQLSAGDVVALLRYRSSYFIVGRVAVPGSDTFAQSAVTFAASTDLVTEFGLNRTEDTNLELTLAGPAWARRAVVLGQFNLSAFNSSAGSDYVNLRPYIAGEFAGASARTAVGDGFMGSVGVSIAFTAEVGVPEFLPRDDFAADPIRVTASAWTDFNNWGSSNQSLVGSAMAIFSG